MHERLFARAGLSLDRLKTFREIAAAGGISAAADDDANRQSQFSRQLRELERFFGAELVRRGRGSPGLLTPAGRRLNEIAGLTLKCLEELQDECAHAPLELKVGAGESLIQWWLIGRLPRLNSGPTPFSLGFENRRNDGILEGLKDGSLDFGVMSRPPRDERLVMIPLGRLEFRLFIPQQLLAGRSAEADAILKDLPLAELTEGSQLGDAVRAEARRRKISLKGVLRLSSYPQIARAVAGGEVAAVLPSLADEAFAGARVSVIPLPFLDQLARSVVLAWNRQHEEVRPSLALVGKLLAKAWVIRKPTV